MTVQFQIVPKVGEEMNFRVPKTEFRFALKARLSQLIVVLTKTDPGKDWGAYEVEYMVKVIE